MKPLLIALAVVLLAGGASPARVYGHQESGLSLSFKVHPHMLRHACGFKLANDGHNTRSLQAYLGHKNIQHTVRYTELSPTRFKSLFRD
jgi:site-specific recombinase XerD